MGFFFLDAEILAGDQKISLSRKKNPKISLKNGVGRYPSENRCSIEKQGIHRKKRHRRIGVRRKKQGIYRHEVRSGALLTLLTYCIPFFRTTANLETKNEDGQKKMERSCSPVSLRKVILDFERLFTL